MPAIAPRSEDLAQLVFFIRGERVLLDADLAALYGVTTGALNRAVKRNAERFPGDFMFRLSNEDWGNLKSQTGISSSPGSILKNAAVFNIKGNDYRLVVAVAYKLQVVYVKFSGTHMEYDAVDAETVDMA